MGPFSIRDQSKIGAVSESRGTPLEFEPLTAMFVQYPIASATSESNIQKSNIFSKSPQPP